MRALHGTAVAPIEMTDGNFRRVEICRSCGSSENQLPRRPSSTEEVLTETAIQSAISSLQSKNEDQYRSRSFDKDWDLHPDSVVVCKNCVTTSFYDNDSAKRSVSPAQEIFMRTPSTSEEAEDFEFMDESYGTGVIIEEIEEEEENVPGAMVQNYQWDNDPYGGPIEQSTENFKMIEVKRVEEKAPAHEISESSLIEPQKLEVAVNNPLVDTQSAESIWSVRKPPSIDLVSEIPKILTPEDYVKEQQDARRPSYITPLDDLYKKYNHQPIHLNGVIRVVQTPPPPRRFSTIGHIRRTSSCGTIDTYGDALKRRPFWYIDENSETTVESESNTQRVIEVEEDPPSDRAGCFPTFWNFLKTHLGVATRSELSEANDTVTDVKPSSASGRGRLARRMTIEEEHAGDYFK